MTNKGHFLGLLADGLHLNRHGLVSQINRTGEQRMWPSGDDKAYLPKKLTTQQFKDFCVNLAFFLGKEVEFREDGVDVWVYFK